MKEFTDTELFDMFSLGGVNTPAITEMPGGLIGGAGLDWTESLWGDKADRKGGKGQQHNGGQGITPEQRKQLVEHRRKLVEQNGTSFASDDLDAEFFLSVPQDWKKIVGALDN